MTTVDSNIVAGQLILEMLARGKNVTVFTHGGSMRPLIPPMSRVEIIPATAESLQIGDVVLFRHREGAPNAVLHRVLQIDRSSRIVTIKGDSVRRPDPPVRFEDVLGVCVEVESRHFRYRLDNPAMRRFNYLIAKASPRLPPLYRLASLAKRAVRAAIPNLSER